MAHRRFVPLIVLVVAGAVALLVRLFEVQVLEHDVWANEAANLVRSGQVVPYRRGRILDARGRLWVRDEDVYRIDFTYRDFRRDHPLGQLAHARGVLELRSVDLWEARASAERWAADLLDLSPARLRAWAQGDALAVGDLDLPATRRAGPERRASRASDLRFYVGRLLGYERADWKRLRRALSEGGGEASFAELYADWHGLTADEVHAGVARHVDESLADLEYLAERLARARAREGDMPVEEAADELLADLENRRRRTENAAADRLFREATGFPPGRFDPDTLWRTVDVEPIAVLLAWEEERTRGWLRAARERWLDWRDAWTVPTLAAQLLQERRRGSPEQVLRRLAATFVHPDVAEAAEPGSSWSWRREERWSLLPDLPTLFDVDYEAPQLAAWLLPFQDPSLRAFDVRGGAAVAGGGAPGDAGWHLLGLVETWRPGVDPAAAPPAVRAEALRVGAEWRELLADPNLRRETLEAALRDLLDVLEEHLQSGLSQALDELARRAAADGDATPGGRLRLAEGRLDRVGERARFVLKDLSSRSVGVAVDPHYELVHLLTRHADRFAGFSVQESRRREPVAVAPDGPTVAAALVGAVRRTDAVRLHDQRKQADELRRLRRKGTRTRAEEELMKELVREVYQPEEVYGGAGIEGYFDPELRGRNGYRERKGLGDRRGLRARSEWALPPVDGQDLTLTIDLDLQRAAEEVLERPEGDPDPAERDQAWLETPVGAIALVTVRGDVLAAASVPRVITPAREAYADAPGRRWRERAIVRERTLTIPDFQPLGSVFKPFVALWALDRFGHDPAEVWSCAALPDGRAGWVDLHCWRPWGHGDVDLAGALRGSCNAYFARLGELYTDEEYRRLLAAFGFGEPTGVKSFGRRPGLPENTASHVLRRNLTQADRRKAANGLAVIEGTPLQLARATVALATGRLPELRLVRAVGERDVPSRSRPVDFAPEHLERVRAALRAVVAERGGTAHGKGLDEASLGFSFAAKTGSADLGVPIQGVEHGTRKHTWVSGWFPAREPQAVLVVFVYDTTVTSSHSAVWVARQFLARPEVGEWLRTRGGVQ